MYWLVPLRPDLATGWSVYIGDRIISRHQESREVDSVNPQGQTERTYIDVAINLPWDLQVLLQMMYVYGLMPRAWTRWRTSHHYVKVPRLTVVARTVT